METTQYNTKKTNKRFISEYTYVTISSYCTGFSEIVMIRLSQSNML